MSDEQTKPFKTKPLQAVILYPERILDHVPVPTARQCKEWGVDYWPIINGGYLRAPELDDGSGTLAYMKVEYEGDFPQNAHDE